MYCHILRVRAIPTLESTDSMIGVNSHQVAPSDLSAQVMWSIHRCHENAPPVIPKVQKRTHIGTHCTCTYGCL